MPMVSFIIPAYNEEEYIQGAISSIFAFCPFEVPFEVVVVDHGSTDETAILSKMSGALVVEFPTASTIAQLRNHGVKRAAGEVFVFLDADTFLTKEWGAAFPEVFGRISSNNRILTGSKRDVSCDSPWVGRFWMGSQAQEIRPKHLGGGHLIVAREVFEEIGGFREDFETGEDFHFCLDAKALGIEIVAEPGLKAVHHGVPATISEFFKREVWHGKGDWVSVAAVAKSKAAQISIFFMALHLMVIVFLFFDYPWSLLSVVASLGVLGICVLSSHYKFRRAGIRVQLVNVFLFYVYYFGRGFSALNNFREVQSRKRER